MPRVDKFNKQILTSIQKQQREEPVEKETFYSEKVGPLSIRLRSTGNIDCYLYKRLKAPENPKSKLYKRLVCSWEDLSHRGIEWARRRADDIARAIIEGADPKLVATELAEHQKREVTRKASIKTLAEIMGAFLDRGKKNGQPFSDRYTKAIKRHARVVYPDWQDMLLTDITEEMVIARHENYGLNNSSAQSNQAFRELRSFFNFAHRKYKTSGLYKNNPVEVLSDDDRWFEERSRKVRLFNAEMKPFLKAAFEEGKSDHTSGFNNGRDSVLMLLFTGLRITNLHSVPLDWIDMRVRGIRIPAEASKNGTGYIIPFNSVSAKIVKMRLEMLDADHDYLFPGIGKRDWYLDNRGFRDRVNLIADTKVTSHDLRRTYKSVGGTMHINPHMLNDLVMHSRNSRTEIDNTYQIFDPDELREASEQIAQKILSEAKFDVMRAIDLGYTGS